jgi:hypothetical protein
MDIIYNTQEAAGRIFLGADRRPRRRRRRRGARTTGSQRSRPPLRGGRRPASRRMRARCRRVACRTRNSRRRQLRLRRNIRPVKAPTAPSESLGPSRRPPRRRAAARRPRRSRPRRPRAGRRRGGPGRPLENIHLRRPQANPAGPAWVGMPGRTSGPAWRGRGRGCPRGSSAPFLRPAATRAPQANRAGGGASGRCRTGSRRRRPGAMRAGGGGGRPQTARPPTGPGPAGPAALLQRRRQWRRRRRRRRRRSGSRGSLRLGRRGTCTCAASTADSGPARRPGPGPTGSVPPTRTPPTRTALAPAGQANQSLRSTKARVGRAAGRVTRGAQKRRAEPGREAPYKFSTKSRVAART